MNGFVFGRNVKLQRHCYGSFTLPDSDLDPDSNPILVYSKISAQYYYKIVSMLSVTLSGRIGAEPIYPDILFSNTFQILGLFGFNIA